MSATDGGAASLHPETRLVHAGILRSQFGETSEALFLTQGHVYDSAEQAEARFLNKDPGFQYARFSNPTVAMLEARMAAFEGAEACRATATGMAAVTAAIMGQVRQGDHVVAAQALFGSCRYVVEEHLPRYGVTSTLVDGTDIAAWRAAVTPQTKVFFLESPSNPTLEVIDIAAVATLAKEVGATLVVDNVFATPLFQRPLELGADCVVYSATKHIDGQGRCLGGLILASQEFIETHVQTFLRQTGPAISPFNAWVMLKALETLPLRVRKQAENAAIVANWLEAQPQLPKVIFPGSPQASAGRHHRPPDERSLDAGRLRGRRRQGRCLPLPQWAQADPHLQQSRRCQEPDRPSRDDDASALQPGDPRQHGHRRGPDPAFDRPRARRRSRGRPGAGAGRGLRLRRHARA